MASGRRARGGEPRGRATTTARNAFYSRMQPPAKAAILIGVISPQQLVRRVAAGAAVSAALLYAGDYVWLRARMARSKPSPMESFTRIRLLAIPLKNGKIEYQIDQLKPEETLTCVHSLFPHYGHAPCWYLKPRANQPIPMTILLSSAQAGRSETMTISAHVALRPGKERSAVVDFIAVLKAEIRTGKESRTPV